MKHSFSVIAMIKSLYAITLFFSSILINEVNETFTYFASIGIPIYIFAFEQTSIDRSILKLSERYWKAWKAFDSMDEWSESAGYR